MRREDAGVCLRVRRGAESVGWVERSETHRLSHYGKSLMGFAALPILQFVFVLHFPPGQERQPLEQMHVLLVLEQRAVQRRDQLARVALA
ncbi:hypothetical protein ACVWWG_000466 [Bradyrhizobium sp. LB7.2]